MPRLEEITYDLALRALADQEGALRDLRARTGTLLTAASLIASFLGGQAIARAELSALVVLGVVAFAACVMLCIYVLLPKEGLIFAIDGPQAYQALYAVREDEEEVQRWLTYWVQGFRSNNHEAVKRLTLMFSLAGVALLFEIVFLALALALG
ncbi:MAG: hypothetical protein ACRDK5_12135 [Solirubrobacterales bacterium]